MVLSALLVFSEKQKNITPPHWSGGVYKNLPTHGGTWADAVSMSFGAGGYSMRKESPSLTDMQRMSRRVGGDNIAAQPKCAHISIQLYHHILVSKQTVANKVFAAFCL